MAFYLYLKSGKHFELIPQIRLTRSKNGTTGTAIVEVNFDQLKDFIDFCDPIYSLALKKGDSLRLADVSHFVWASGKPIKLIGIFLFSTIYEKQDFFNYYPYYALSNSLEFFPAQFQEKTLKS